MAKTITVTGTVKAPFDKVWACWNEPQYLMKWMHASEDWECSNSVIDFRVGGTFVHTLGAKDGSMSFDLPGTFTAIEKNPEGGRVDLVLGDGRTVKTNFMVQGDSVLVTETFEMENENPEEQQRAGWQAMMDSFKKYVESNG